MDLHPSTMPGCTAPVAGADGPWVDAQALASPQRPQAVMECAVKLVRMAAVAEQVVSASDLPATLDALSKQAASSSTGLLAHLIGLAHTKRPAKYALPQPGLTPLPCQSPYPLNVPGTLAQDRQVHGMHQPYGMHQPCYMDGAHVLQAHLRLACTETNRLACQMHSSLFSDAAVRCTPIVQVLPVHSHCWRGIND